MSEYVPNEEQFSAMTSTLLDDFREKGEVSRAEGFDKFIQETGKRLGGLGIELNMDDPIFKIVIESAWNTAWFGASSIGVDLAMSVATHLSDQTLKSIAKHSKKDQ